MTMTKQSDPVIDDVRAVRHEISARVDHDPERLVAYYIELQQRYRERLIESEEAVHRASEAAT